METRQLKGRFADSLEFLARSLRLQTLATDSQRLMFLLENRSPKFDLKL